MANRRLRAKHDFEHHGKKYRVGEHLEVDEHEANNLIHAGHAEHVDPHPSGPPPQNPPTGPSSGGTAPSDAPSASKPPSGAPKP